MTAFAVFFAISLCCFAAALYFAYRFALTKIDKRLETFLAAAGKRVAEGAAERKAVDKLIEKRLDGFRNRLDDLAERVSALPAVEPATAQPSELLERKFIPVPAKNPFQAMENRHANAVIADEMKTTGLADAKRRQGGNA